MFDLLAPAIKKYIREKGWEKLKPIQEFAIPKILLTEKHYILASKTASGKTEAAFLPILSKVDFNQRGVQVLYISPLIALINDQFERVEDLCENLEISVTKWHGEANKSPKTKLLKEPSGVVLITPESLEAMFVSKPYDVEHLFDNLHYIVIDEVHYFIGTDRGKQLQSLLARLQEKNQRKCCIVGLSATIGDLQESKKITGDVENTAILLDETKNEMLVEFNYFSEQGSGFSFDLLKDLYLKTKDHQVLIFPNSRGKVEEVAVKLGKISDKIGGHSHYFSHHSSVDKQTREYIEHFAKNNKYEHFCIACTSTLELGIDIGSIDMVVQLDSTQSVASLIQRVGRSGRQKGQKSHLLLYATNPWSLLQSLSCWLLYQEGFIEPSHINQFSYDLLVHQILSITKETAGIWVMELVQKVQRNHAFCEINTNEILEIMQEMLRFDLLEQIGKEVIVGIEGERYVNTRFFYSVFQSEQNFKMIFEQNTIGEIPYTPQLTEDQNVFLAAKMWKIQELDFKGKKIHVIPAYDGKKPVFLGQMGVIHQKIREKMLWLISSNEEYSFLDESSKEVLAEIRNDFSKFDLQSNELPIRFREEKAYLYTFTGTKINRTLKLLFEKMGIKVDYNEQRSEFELKVLQEDFFKISKLLFQKIDKIDKYIEEEIDKNPSILSFSKWVKFLPLQYQIRLVKYAYYDVEETKKFLNNTLLKTANEN